jgi:hypothetical protein
MVAMVVKVLPKGDFCCQTLGSTMWQVFACIVMFKEQCLFKDE